MIGWFLGLQNARVPLLIFLTINLTNIALDLLFVENIGNLICPVSSDTGANLDVALTSVPEGDDKPLKYPLMFQTSEALIINKIDLVDFDQGRFNEVQDELHQLAPYLVKTPATIAPTPSA